MNICIRKYKEKNTQHHSVQGFTFIEMLMAVAIVAVLMTVVLQGSSSFRDSALLMKDVNDAENFLKDARSRTLSSVNGSSYGVYFTSSTTVLFRGSAYVASDPSNETIRLSPRVEMSNIGLSGSSSSVTFRRLTGEASATGTITFRLKNNTSKTKTITLYGSGLYKTQ